MKRIYLLLVFFLNSYANSAQPVPFILKGALKENRQQLHRSLVNNSIIKNLSLPLTDSTEEQWQVAFWVMELINYRSAWADNKIYSAFNNIEKSSTRFQRALLELVYTNYQDIFLKQVRSLLLQTKDTKIFAMCVVYVLSGEKNSKEKVLLSGKIKEKLKEDPGNPILLQLQYQINDDGTAVLPSIGSLLEKDLLPGNVIMFSFQRRNRNFPGLVIVRDAAGKFISDNGKLFSVPQLARSIANLPGYLTNGNTPEGIFRMDGFDTSKSNFIGPTTNIQLTMPFEYKASHFYKDSTLADSIWNIEQYENLLPAVLKKYYPIYQSYYAGKAGRTEIIAHGTTIDPAYYKNKPYYPLTPTQGCLCSKETWNDETGRLKESDQQKLVDAIIKAGGPYGYAVVINLDDQQKPVDPDEILDFLQTANHK